MIREGEYDYKSEVWKDIPGYVGYYQVSNMGRVRSLPRFISTTVMNAYSGLRTETHFRQGKILTPIIPKSKTKHLTNSQKQTYTFIYLHKDGEKRKSVLLKKLVAEAFLPDFKPTTVTNRIKFKKPSLGHRADNLYIEK